MNARPTTTTSVKNNNAPMALASFARMLMRVSSIYFSDATRAAARKEVGELRSQTAFCPSTMRSLTLPYRVACYSGLLRSGPMVGLTILRWLPSGSVEPPPLHRRYGAKGSQL